MNNICVLGNGAWGRALASLAKDCGHHVEIWSRHDGSIEKVRRADALMIAVPAQTVATLLPQLEITHEQAIIITAKGIDRATNRFMCEVARKNFGTHQIYILSGPSFAEDVTRKLPTAVTLASSYLENANKWAKALSQPHFRIYPSDDPLGVCLGGSLKNILAIACGISDGKGLGASAKAALTTRGFAELLRLGTVLKCGSTTLFGLSGLGDLLLTCSSPQSRNYMFGKRLGEGMSVADALAASNGVVEGVESAQAALQIALKYNLVLPITQAVNAIVDNGANPNDMIAMLLSRPVGSEF